MSDFSSAHLAVGGLIPASARAAIESAKFAAETNRLLSGDALYMALMAAVEELAKRAPAEHDVLVQAFGLVVTEVHLREPNALVFCGYDNNGNQSFAVAHFSQVVASVVYLPKRGPDKVLTGFWREPAAPIVNAN